MQAIAAPESAAATLLRVRVVDRFSMIQGWGHGAGGVVVREVEIAATCPCCGGPRGAPELQRFHEDGEPYFVHTWRNRCGHVDRYGAVLREVDLYEGGEVVTNRYAGSWIGRSQREL